MATLQSTIALQDNFSSVIYHITDSVNMSVAAVENFQSVLDKMPTSFGEDVEEQAYQATEALEQLQNVAANGAAVEMDISTADAQTQLENIQAKLESILPMQNAINEVARNTLVLPKDTAETLTGVNQKIESMQGALLYLNNSKIDLNSDYAQIQLAALSEGIEATTEKQTELNAALGDIPSQVTATVNVDVNIPDWQSDNLEVFTSTGAERFNQEIASANSMMTELTQKQAQINATAATMKIFPSNAITDMSSVQSRLEAIQARILAIEQNPINMSADEANAELEQLRGQLDSAIQQQQALNAAVDNMDVEGANAAYIQLSRTIGNTEKYIRDNVNAENAFNSAIDQSTEKAGLLNAKFLGIGAAILMAGKKIIDFIGDCTDKYNDQLDAENQLALVLNNMLDEDYVAEFAVTADTTEAMAAVDAISDTAANTEIAVDVSARTQALQAEIDGINAKATEISSNGIYGDEVMLAGAAELATYFTDTDAVEAMMDTLANYATGMQGGVTAMDTESMTQYATNLGKIMSGSYQAMTEKGFKFTEAQEAIIEGTATQQQIIDTLGAEYLSMSEDMQAAAVITQIIDESWAGLYENMSNTPAGKIQQMTNAFGDLQETIGGRLYPYILLFVDAINNHWGQIESVLNGFTSGLQVIMSVLSKLFSLALTVGAGIADNWSIISPIVYGIVGAFLAYNAVLAAHNAIQAITNTIKTIGAIRAVAHGAAITAEMTATTGMTAAQLAFNAALYACPLTWVVVAIIAVIAVIYGAIAAINHFADKTYSATGFIMGLFATLGAFLYNQFVVPVQNKIAELVNFFGNVFNNPVAAIKVLFYDMCLDVLGYFSSLMHGIEDLINKIPGIEIDITSGLDNVYKSLEAAQQAVKDESGWVEYVSKIEYADYSDWAAQGYSFGEGLEDKISNFFSAPEIEDFDLDQLSGYDMAGDISDTADNTAAMANEMSASNEELELLREIAERQAVNQFTTAEIKVDFQSTAEIKNDMDIDGFVGEFENRLREALVSTAEGVHI